MSEDTAVHDGGIYHCRDCQRCGMIAGLAMQHEQRTEHEIYQSKGSSP